MGAETTAANARPKTVLICPTCGYESRPDGDWHARRHDTVDGEMLALGCPDCDTDITHRPLSEATRTEPAAAD